MTPYQLETLQEIMFDMIDIIETNEENLKDIKIEQYSEFETLMEFLIEQRDKLQALEAEVNPELD